MVVVLLMVVQRQELVMEFIGMMIIHGEWRKKNTRDGFRKYFHRNISERLHGDQTNQRAELTVRILKSFFCCYIYWNLGRNSCHGSSFNK